MPSKTMRVAPNCLAFACNSLTRSVTAIAAGGWRFARVVIAALALPLLLGAGLAGALQ